MQIALTHRTRRTLTLPTAPQLLLLLRIAVRDTRHLDRLGVLQGSTDDRDVGEVGNQHPHQPAHALIRSIRRVKLRPDLSEQVGARAPGGLTGDEPCALEGLRRVVGEPAQRCLVVGVQVASMRESEQEDGPRAVDVDSHQRGGRRRHGAAGSIRHGMVLRDSDAGRFTGGERTAFDPGRGIAVRGDQGGDLGTAVKDCGPAGAELLAGSARHNRPDGRRVDRREQRRRRLPEPIANLAAALIRSLCPPDPSGCHHKTGRDDGGGDHEGSQLRSAVAARACERA